MNIDQNNTIQNLLSLLNDASLRSSRKIEDIMDNTGTLKDQQNQQNQQKIQQQLHPLFQFIPAVAAAGAPPHPHVPTAPIQIQMTPHGPQIIQPLPQTQQLHHPNGIIPPPLSVAAPAGSHNGHTPIHPPPHILSHIPANMIPPHMLQQFNPTVANNAPPLLQMIQVTLPNGTTGFIQQPLNAHIQQQQQNTQNQNQTLQQQQVLILSPPQNQNQTQQNHNQSNSQNQNVQQSIVIIPQQQQGTLQQKNIQQQHSFGIQRQQPQPLSLQQQQQLLFQQQQIQLFQQQQRLAQQMSLANQSNTSLTNSILPSIQINSISGSKNGIMSSATTNTSGSSISTPMNSSSTATDSNMASSSTTATTLNTTSHNDEDEDYMNKLDFVAENATIISPSPKKKDSGQKNSIDSPLDEQKRFYNFLNSQSDSKFDSTFSKDDLSSFLDETILNNSTNLNLNFNVDNSIGILQQMVDEDSNNKNNNNNNQDTSEFLPDLLLQNDFTKPGSILDSPSIISTNSTPLNNVSTPDSITVNNNSIGNNNINSGHNNCSNSSSVGRASLSIQMTDSAEKKKNSTPAVSLSDFENFEDSRGNLPDFSVSPNTSISSNNEINKLKKLLPPNSPIATPIGKVSGESKRLPASNIGSTASTSSPNRIIKATLVTKTTQLRNSGNSRPSSPISPQTNIHNFNPPTATSMHPTASSSVISTKNKKKTKTNPKSSLSASTNNSSSLSKLKHAQSTPSLILKKTFSFDQCSSTLDFSKNGNNSSAISKAALNKQGGTANKPFFVATPPAKQVRSYSFVFETGSKLSGNNANNIGTAANGGTNTDDNDKDVIMKAASSTNAYPSYQNKIKLNINTAADSVTRGSFSSETSSTSSNSSNSFKVRKGSISSQLLMINNNNNSKKFSNNPNNPHMNLELDMLSPTFAGHNSLHGGLQSPALESPMVVQTPIAQTPTSAAPNGGFLNFPNTSGNVIASSYMNGSSNGASGVSNFTGNSISNSAGVTNNVFFDNNNGNGQAILNTGGSKTGQKNPSEENFTKNLMEMLIGNSEINLDDALMEEDH